MPQRSEVGEVRRVLKKHSINKLRKVRMNSWITKCSASCFSFINACTQILLLVSSTSAAYKYIIYLIEWLGGKVFHKRKVYAVAQCFNPSVWPTFPGNNYVPHTYKQQLLETTQQHFAFSFKIERSSLYQFMTRAANTHSCNRAWEVITHQGSQWEPTGRNKPFRELFCKKSLVFHRQL